MKPTEEGLGDLVSRLVDLHSKSALVTQVIPACEVSDDLFISKLKAKSERIDKLLGENPKIPDVVESE